MLPSAPTRTGTHRTGGELHAEVAARSSVSDRWPETDVPHDPARLEMNVGVASALGGSGVVKAQLTTELKRLTAALLQEAIALRAEVERARGTGTVKHYLTGNHTLNE